MSARRPDLPDHVGILLWEAAAAWKRRFAREMAAAGHPWYAEARGALLGHIGREGAAQGTIAARAGMTKQAVQQHVDALVADGVAVRADDPADARRRIVRLTAAGRAALDDGDRIKARLEADLARRLGDARLAALREMLEEVAEGD